MNEYNTAESEANYLNNPFTWCMNRQTEGVIILHVFVVSRSRRFNVFLSKHLNKEATCITITLQTMMFIISGEILNRYFKACSLWIISPELLKFNCQNSCFQSILAFSSCMKNRFTKVIIKHYSTECAQVYFLCHLMILHLYNH